MWPLDLQKRMQSLGVREQDLEENFVAASGPGGQNVNKVATCVCLSHPSTGIRVKCQATRSQELNRVQARFLLCEKIQRQRREERQRAIADREKMRRQKRKRSAAGKELMLAKKHIRGKRKLERRKVDLRQEEDV